MTSTETAAQLRLAAEILETGHPWEGQGSSGWAKMEILSPVAILYAGQRIRPILARPPYEAELHNPDGLTAEQVGVGYRLLLPDEMQPQKYEWGFKNPNGSIDWMYGSQNEETAKQCNPKYAVRVPLSVPWPEKPKSAELTPVLAAKGYEQYGFGPGITVVEQPDPYAELKKAHAAGRVIQVSIGPPEAREWDDLSQAITPAFKTAPERYRIKPDDSPPWIEWHGGPCPLRDEEVEEWEYKCRDGFHASKDESGLPSDRRWSHSSCPHYGDIIAYRVLKTREPKPKVPLGPEDVLPGSIFIVPPRKPSTWHAVTGVYEDCVQLDHGDFPFDELMEDGWLINRSIPTTGKWNPNAWEACER